VSAAPRLSVLLVNWNTADLLESCLESLAGDLRSGRCEVIVVDNGSSDDSAARVAARHPEVQLIRNERNLGFTRATNQAWAAAKADFALMLNSDTVVPEGTLARCLAFLEAHPEVGALGCRVRYPDGRHQGSCFRFPSLLDVTLNALYLAQLFPHSPLWNRNRYGQQSFESVREVDCVMGGFLLLRRAAVPATPLLDEGYWMYGEEADLLYRMARAGWRTVYYPDASVVHHHSASSRDPEVGALVYEAKQRAILRFLWKWRGAATAWCANAIMLLGLLPRALGWALGDLAAALRAGRAPRAERLLRARAVGFHLAAAVSPARFASSWDWTRGGGANQS